MQLSTQTKPPIYQKQSYIGLNESTIVKPCKGMYKSVTHKIQDRKHIE